ncbi:hypothetical protein C8J56DRAFT_888384 [Mycena floridula]|nr:hypothetical protein C8J56DRAFT_888384 [Mycena floridula]
MGTIVDRAIQAAPATAPLRRQRARAEIIDVDSFVDPRPRPRRSEVISLLDSDDELAEGSARRVRARFFSPPPPVQQPEQVPPMPRLPFSVGDFVLPPPMRRQAPAFPDDLVVPNQTPFNFEAAFDPAPAVRARPPRRAVPPRPQAPPASIVLGGALISSHEEPNARNRNMQHIVTSRRHRAAQRRFQRDQEVADATATRVLLSGLSRENLFDDPAFGIFFNVAPRIGPQEDDYKSSYTHPDRPDPGFTFNFESEPQTLPPTIHGSSSSKDPIVIIDEDEPTASLSSVLACANCLSPLVTGGLTADSKLWGLRCGHLIDGACLAKLSIPAEGSYVKGKGKAKAVVREPSPDSDSEMADENPIRSRLRSSHHEGSSTSYFRSLVPSFLSKALPRPILKVKKPKVEEKHEWGCPVAGCGKLHTSVNTDGNWVQETERGEGAIALFV